MQRGGKALSPPGGASSTGRAVQHLACRRWFLLLFFFLHLLFFSFSLFPFFSFFPFSFFSPSPFRIFLRQPKDTMGMPPKRKGLRGEGARRRIPSPPPSLPQPPKGQNINFFSPASCQCYHGFDGRVFKVAHF